MNSLNKSAPVLEVLLLGDTLRAALCFAACLAIGAAPAEARDRKHEAAAPPSAYTQLVECRALTKDAERLACYDARVAKLQQAQENKEIVVVDKAEVNEAKRGLFGFTLPQIKLFGGGAGDEDVNELATTITGVKSYDYGRWRFVLENGSVWDQIDSEPLPIDPHAGDKIVIKRAALGSFKAKVGNQPPIRVRRVQ